MRYRILASLEVAAGYRLIPDHRDRAEAEAIIESLGRGDQRGVRSDVYTQDGLTWTRHMILLSSGRGFVSYSPIFTDEGEPAVLLWPVVWCDV